MSPRPLTIDELQRLRATQATWRRIAGDQSIRESARENAANQVALIEAQIRGARR
jgi:hypothetical protein